VALFSSKSQMVHMFDLLFLHSMVSLEFEIKHVIGAMALRIANLHKIDEAAKPSASRTAEP
jgi:hypothetical protein